jgi:hypothetical protein
MDVIEELLREPDGRLPTRKQLRNPEYIARLLEASYARGYMDCLEEPEPDPALAHLREREAWARLPIPE